MNPSEEHERVLFVPGEVVFHLQHPAMESPEATRQMVLESLGKILPSSDGKAKKKGKGKKGAGYGDWLDRLTVPEANTPIVTFQTPSQSATSLVPIQLASANDNVLDVLRDAYRNLQGNSMDVFDQVSLTALCPNWLSRNLHHGAATGGPGSWPTQIGAPETNANKFKFTGESLVSLQPHQEKLGNGSARVAILDTILNGDLPNAFSYLHVREYLIQDPNNRYAISHLRSYTPRQDHFRMPDHGTFIASIVNAIAPETSVYLYEVLNDFAVGSYVSVAWGLSTALGELATEGTPLIINCSFMLSLPDGNIGEAFIEDLSQSFNGDVEKTITTLGASIRTIFQTVIQTPNVAVVAAAGNDATAEVRPPARYPAAFKGVIGVGALPKGNPCYPSGRYRPSSYSNFAYSRSEEKFPNEGFMVFGGELDQPMNNAHPPSNSPQAHDGVLGRYVGNYPRRNPSDGGIDAIDPGPSAPKWARWAGTSFAAPIISGILAAQTGAHPLDTSLAPPSDTYLTVEGENVIVAQQG